MLEVFLQDPGIIFVLDTGRVVRTPIKFIIDEKECDLYECLIRSSPIQNYTIEKTDKEKPKKKILSSKIKPNKNSDLKLSVNLQ